MVNATFHKLTSVTPLEGLRLAARFENGQERIYDVKPLLQRFQPFEALDRVPYLFQQARIDTGGYGIIWNDELDLSAEEIYHHGSAVSSIGVAHPGY